MDTFGTQDSNAQYFKKDYGGRKMYSWIKALNGYSYPVDFHDYERRDRFPNFFNREISGDRDSTIKFENYFRENARKSREVYFEVIFWKVYSYTNNRLRTTSRIVNHILERKVSSESLYDAIKHFVDSPTPQNLRSIRNLLGIRTNVLAIPLTFPAFLNPEKYPMVDRKVAQWVNTNLNEHNRKREAKLTEFVSLPLTDDDFESYLNWVYWCRELAQVLTEKTGMHWRARDVEMAVFTAQRKNLELTVL